MLQHFGKERRLQVLRHAAKGGVAPVRVWPDAIPPPCRGNGSEQGGRRVDLHGTSRIERISMHLPVPG
jgi:hypothetical protein